jgi:hypothetical protein
MREGFAVRQGDTNHQRLRTADHDRLYLSVAGAPLLPIGSLHQRGWWHVTHARLSCPCGLKKGWTLVSRRHPAKSVHGSRRQRVRPNSEGSTVFARRQPTWRYFVGTQQWLNIHHKKQYPHQNDWACHHAALMAGPLTNSTKLCSIRSRSGDSPVKISNASAA